MRRNDRGNVMHLVSSQSEGGAFTHVQDFACLEQGKKGRQVALVGDITHEAAHVDFLFLSGRVSLPIVPLEVRVFYGYFLCFVDETVEVPLRSIDAAVEVREHGNPAQKLSDEDVEFEIVGKVAVVIYPGRCKEVQRCSSCRAIFIIGRL